LLVVGAKVVSKKIGIIELEEVAKVFRRPPVIWDNIHANDYDPRRLFLGPFDGRSTDIIPYVRGVLTNPNCEFEANYIPLHTLGQWSRSNKNAVKKDIVAGQLYYLPNPIHKQSVNEITVENYDFVNTVSSQQLY